MDATIPDIPLSLALAGLDAAALGVGAAAVSRVGAVDRGAEVRAVLAWARGQGLRAVHLNAATPGVRPRDLDRSARRDLAATLRRNDLECSGLDLWIPPEHFTDPAHVDRAVASVLGAIDLAHDLATLAGGSVVSARFSRPGVVSLIVPESAPSDAVAAIAARAVARGVRIADHAWPVRAGEGGAVGIEVGMDPAVLLSRGEDPAAEVSRLGRRLASARVSDVARGGGLAGSRVAVGARGGSLDVMLYLVSLATAGYAGHGVIDLRGLSNQADALRTAMRALGREVQPATA